VVGKQRRGVLLEPIRILLVVVAAVASLHVPSYREIGIATFTESNAHVLSLACFFLLSDIDCRHVLVFMNELQQPMVLESSHYLQHRLLPIRSESRETRNRRKYTYFS
jgi:hypothetical protein